MSSLWVSCVLAIVFACAACSSSPNCSTYCNRFAECVDANLNVDACVEVCGDYEEDTDDTRARVEECASCVDDGACSEATSSCIDDCFGVPTQR